MRISIDNILLAFVLSYGTAFANNSIDTLLEDIKQNTDLSEKTKLENGGISYIYTREDLEKMQVYTLQDILKTTYPFGYSENKYGVVDPYSTNSAVPYMSSSIKIYIDNQELTTGFYGSGLSVYGNMNIDFVDHVEVYSGNPTFEFSTEPAFTIIRLFSKSAIRDAGSKVSLVTGVDGEKGISTYHADTLENHWSYFTFLSILDNKRKKYENDGAILSRDSKDTHIFATLKKDNQNIVFSGVVSKRDTFMGGSVFATPDVANLSGNYIHLGYDSKYKNLTVLATYDRYRNKVEMYDKYKDTIEFLNNQYNYTLPYNLESDIDTSVYTVGATYTVSNNKNHFNIGSKYRYKEFEYYKFIINDIDIVNMDEYSYKFNHTNQTTMTTFVENQYFLKSNKVITTGVSFTDVNNNNSDQDDNLYAYRLGYTYTNHNWVSKTVASYIESTLDPYLVNNNSYLLDYNSKIKKEKKSVYIQNIKYEKGLDKLELIASLVSIKDALMPDPQNDGLLISQKELLDVKSTVLRYTKKYHSYDKIELSVGYNDVINVPSIGHLVEHNIGLKGFNRYKKFDFYNELLYYKNNYDDSGAIDYNLAITYHITDDLLFSLKGINLLDKAHTVRYSTLDINSIPERKYLYIPSIDKKILVSMEYTF